MLDLTNSTTILIATLIIVTTILVTVVVLLPKLIGKGVKLDSYIETVDAVLGTAETITNIASTILPNSPIVNILKLIEKYARISVHQAEQLYLTSKLTADQRNDKAKETIYATIKLLKIEVTPEMEKIIDGIIEAEVLALGHKGTPVEIDSKISTG